MSPQKQASFFLCLTVALSSLSYIPIIRGGTAPGSGNLSPRKPVFAPIRRDQRSESQASIEIPENGKRTMDHTNIARIQMYGRQLLNYALKVGFFIWHYFEMMLAMGVGVTLFELLVHEIPNSTSYTLGFRPRTFLYISGISLSMMLVMIAWMIVRGMDGVIAPKWQLRCFYRSHLCP